MRDDDQTKWHDAAEALCRLSAVPSSEAGRENKVAIQEAGGIPLLVALLSNAHAGPGTQSKAMLALFHIVMWGNSDNEVAFRHRLAFREAGGIEAFVAYVERVGFPACCFPTLALHLLSTNTEENALAIALARGRAEAIVELARRGSVTVHGQGLVRGASAAAKRKAALVVAALLREFPVPQVIKAVIMSYL
jgi:hypothetical protein